MSNDLLPAEPVLELIRSKSSPCKCAGECVHVWGLAAKMYVSRWGGSLKAATHLLYRWRNGEARSVTIDTADRWCIALGSHLAIVYPELYELDKESP